MSGPDPDQTGEVLPHLPDGEPLTDGRRMTYRQARPWLRRGEALVGVWPSHAPVEWMPEQDRTELTAAARRAEGRDCNVAGDVLLFRRADGRPVLVVQGPPC
jgi:hypothetical protein